MTLEMPSNSSPPLKGPIRVLIVDDSALVRQLLTEVFAGDPDFEVVGTAIDPIIAREKIKQLNPDVITLDIEMPRMNGIEFLTRLMRLRPMPVVMISTLTVEGADVTLQALELGAVDYVSKPTRNLTESMDGLREEILAKVRAAAGARLRGATRSAKAIGVGDIQAVADRSVIGIGASTGGVEALGTLLAGLPAKFPPIVIVQHMPAAFTTRFAARLNDQFPFPVVEGYDGMAVLPNSVIVAPGGRHLRVVETQGRLTCRLSDDPPISGHRPSVDVLFNSLADLGAKAAGVLLTGMGRDGADGLSAMRLAGAMTIAQDKATSVVFGMPKAAIDNGAACIQLPLQRIAAAMLQMSV